MENNKKTTVFAIILVIILILAVIGFTYSYFAITIKQDGKVDVETETTSPTNVTYTPGPDINLINAEPGAIAESEFSISLEAPNKTEDAIEYGFIWNITDNDFEYVYEHSGDPQLTYDLYYRITENDEWIPYVIDGDCTTWLGSPKIVDGLTLTADANTTSTIYWKFVLEYNAYDYNQAVNMSKVLKGNIELDSKDI